MKQHKNKDTIDWYYLLHFQDGRIKQISPNEFSTLFGNNKKHFSGNLIEEEKTGKDENFDRRPTVQIPIIDEEHNEVIHDLDEINESEKESKSEVKFEDDQNLTNEEILAKFPKKSTKSKFNNKSIIKNHKKFIEEERLSKNKNA